LKLNLLIILLYCILKRIDIDNYKEKSFIKQKDICSHCKLALANNDNNDFSLNIFGNDLKIHYNDKIAEMQKIL